MKFKTVTNSLFILIAIAGVSLSIYGKLNPELANQYWSELGPNYRIGILTAFFGVACIATFPSKRLGEKRLAPTRYIKPIIIFGVLIVFWYQWLSAI